jgi:sialidase-1
MKTKLLLIRGWLGCCVLLSMLSPALAQPDSTRADWKGFEKVSFRFEGHSAYYVKPARARSGTPWVWRAHFPDWHTDMDSLLLARGFHVAYLNTNDLFGHPKALRLWDNFYRFLTTQRGFASKVALEGVSRGGLYMYGWAKRNPDKVSCIYAEAPVCDPLSWPGGKGRAQPAADEWAKWLSLYGLTEEEARAFRDRPLDQLEGLAAYKVPILHVVSLADAIVPVAENTFPLVEAYMRLGGPATVYSMSRGEQRLQGHHFPIERPERFADFIEQHSVPIRPQLSAATYHTLGSRLPATLKALGPEATVAFLGGSITYNPGWRTKVQQYLQERYPATRFRFITAGIPSLGSTPHAFRFGRDVLAQGTPDLLFIESAVNDRTNGFTEKAQVRALEGIVQQALAANPAMGLVLMAFADPENIASYEAGNESVEVAVHRRVAAQYGAAFVNLAQEVQARIRNQEFTWTYDFKDLHPSPFGQEVYFSSLKTLLQNAEAIPTSPTSPPGSVLDPYSYAKGRYLPVSSASALSGFRQVARWTPDPPAPTRAGFVEVPMLVGEQPYASFELRFEGRAIGLAVVSGPDAGSIVYQIDGGPERTLDLFTQWSPQLHLPWYLMLADELKPGKHRLRVRIAPQAHPKSSGQACRIVYFLVN